MDLFDLPYDLVSVKVFNDSSIVLFFALSFLLLAVVHTVFTEVRHKVTVTH